MRRRSSLLVAVAYGCNWGYGLGSVGQRDAAYYDAHPATCPPLGEVPTFDHGDLQQDIDQNCNHYTRSSGHVRALASCFTGGIKLEVFEGLPDGTLVQSPGLESGVYVYDFPRISDDGAFATVVRHPPMDPTSMAREVVLVHRDASTWSIVSSLGLGLQYSSEPTSTVPMHVLAYRDLDAVHELVADGAGNWLDAAIQSVFGTQTPHISPDGLRAWSWNGSSAGPTTYYDRATLDEPFTARGAIVHSEGFQDAFLTSDCGRLYFSTLSRVWFAHQPY